MTSTNTTGAPAPALDDLQDEIRATLAGYLSYEPASEATDEVVEAIGLEALLTRLADAEAGLPARCPTTPDLFASDVARLTAQNAALKEALDEISMTVGYIVTHGVVDEPSPPPEGGGPQVVHVTTKELGALIHRIGNTARTALKEAGDAA